MLITAAVLVPNSARISGYSVAKTRRLLASSNIPERTCPTPGASPFGPRSSALRNRFGWWSTSVRARCLSVPLTGMAGSSSPSSPWPAISRACSIASSIACLSLRVSPTASRAAASARSTTLFAATSLELVVIAISDSRSSVVSSSVELEPGIMSISMPAPRSAPPTAIRPASLEASRITDSSASDTGTRANRPSAPTAVSPASSPQL